MNITPGSLTHPGNFEKCPKTAQRVDQLLTPDVLADRDRSGRWIDISVMLNQACQSEMRWNQDFPPFVKP